MAAFLARHSTDDTTEQRVCTFTLRQFMAPEMQAERCHWAVGLTMESLSVCSRLLIATQFASTTRPAIWPASCTVLLD